MRQYFIQSAHKGKHGRVNRLHEGQGDEAIHDDSGFQISNLEPDALIQYIDAMTLACRIASREDLEEIVAIYNSTIPSRMVTADLEPISVESRYGWFDQHTPQRRPLWVVELPHGIVGWLSLSDFYGRPAYHRTAEVSVYVRTEDRRSGVGAFLLSHAIAQSPLLGIDNLIGFIYGHNTPSLKLFERFGFVRWGELPRVCVLDGVERDVVVVGRRIGDS